MISVVIPAYNEGEGIRLLHERLAACAPSWQEDYEFILVDDGSSDRTLAIAQELASVNPQLRVISLSRNFGHQAAVTAGLEHARGDLIAVIDADLQDPPEVLAEFFNRCREGYDVIYGIRTKRKEGTAKRLSYSLFYRILDRLADISIPLDAGDFCVMNRRSLDALNALPERSRFIRGLRSWIGFRQTGVVYERDARASGEPKYSFWKLINLAVTGIVNFSNKPLRMISVLGMLLGMLSIVLGAVVLIQYVGDITILGYNPRQTRGWTSVILAILVLASAQLFCLGIIGEYLGVIFEEIKRRPLYLVRQSLNAPKPNAPADFQP